MIYRYLAKSDGLVLQCEMRLLDGLYVTFTSRRSNKLIPMAQTVHERKVLGIHRPPRSGVSMIVSSRCPRRGLPGSLAVHFSGMGVSRQLDVSGLDN